ncbi:MAG: TonB family protein [bacterium]
MKRFVGISCVVLLIGLVGSLVGEDKIVIEPSSPIEKKVVEKTINIDGTTEEAPAKRVQITQKLKKSILDTLKVDGSEIATITMGNGDKIYMKFFPEDAPNTVKNFIMLANLNFYDGLTFHRVEPGFLVQGGDPAGNGTGGAGYNIKAEFNSRRHILGTVAMARAEDPNSASSQFYVCLQAIPSLDATGNRYTVFGQIIRGMDEVKGIRVGDKIRSIRIEPKNYAELQIICKGDPVCAIYTAPTIKSITLPDYPASESSLKGSEGRINLRLHINKKGEVEDVKFLPSDITYDQPHVKALVKNWVFTPAKIGETVIEDNINLPIEFKVINDKQCEIRCANEQKLINL